MPFVATDNDLERTEKRAADLYRFLSNAPPALHESVRTTLPNYDERTWSTDAAREVIAREHGVADWGELTQRIADLAEGRHEEPLFDAVQATRIGDADTLTRILGDHPSVLERHGTHGHSLLGLAVRAATNERSIPLRRGTPGQRSIVATLLAAGADPSRGAAYGWTPLHTAAMSGDRQLIESLLEAGAAVDSVYWEEDGATPLALALFYAKTQVGRTLASHETEPLDLRCAASIGDDDALNACFETDGELRSHAHRGRAFYRPLLLFPMWKPTPTRQETLDEALTWAARNGQLESVRTLVARGADVNANPYRGTALLWSAYSGQRQVATWLLANGAEPSLQHDFGGTEHGKGATALHLAAQFGNLAFVRLLLEQGADPTVRDAAFDSDPAGWAEFSGQTETAQLIRSHGS